MAILGAIVAHQRSPTSTSSQSEAFGFRALKPAIAIHPQFLEMLVSRLSSADHALCANALQLINGLMRDAISNEGEAEWPKFVARLQDLGVISGVYTLMQSTAVQDLAHPLLEFQGLTKTLLRKYRDVPIDLHRPEHRRALKGVHLASNPDRPSDSLEDGKDKKHNPEKWRRLGFETENPGFEFEEAGYLGMMDLVDYVRKQELSFQKTLLEQSTLAPRTRCPIARASLAVTVMLYDLFEAERSDLDDAKSYLALDSKSSYDRIFKPLILQWSRIHLAGLQAFFRLWKATGAERDEFSKLVDLVRILLETVVGGAKREKSVEDVEFEIRDFDYERLRQVQMELFQMTYEDIWGHHLRQVRDETCHEAVQFMKEQRIRCLLAGAWFSNHSAWKSEAGQQDSRISRAPSYRYVKLSHNRRYLHYADLDIKGDQDLELDSLPEKRKPLFPMSTRMISCLSLVISPLTFASRSRYRLFRRLKRFHQNPHICTFALLKHDPQKAPPILHNPNHHPRLPPRLSHAPRHIPFCASTCAFRLEIHGAIQHEVRNLSLQQNRDPPPDPSSGNPLLGFGMAGRPPHASSTATPDV